MVHKLTMEEMHRLTVEEFRSSEKLPLTVVIDNVRSQHNIGSVFRTADAFRVEHIAICGISSTPPHREIHKTALGAEESVDWSYHEDTVACVRELKARGYKVYAVEQVSDSLMLDELRMDLLLQPDGVEVAGGSAEEEDRRGKLAVVVGNEVEGVQEEVLDWCDGAIEIPQYGTKHSLNVSCASAIVMWEIMKQMNKKA